VAPADVDVLLVVRVEVEDPVGPDEPEGSLDERAAFPGRDDAGDAVVVLPRTEGLILVVRAEPVLLVAVVDLSDRPLGGPVSDDVSCEVEGVRPQS